MKKSRFEQMQDQMKVKLGPEQGGRIAGMMKDEYDVLCGSCKDRPEAFERHMHKNIFPVAASFRALQKEGIERQQAAEIAGDAFLELIEEPAEAIRKILRIPGLYRMMPWLWKKYVPELFGEDAGFRFRFYHTDRHRVKFDMLECPYLHLCRQLDCMELAPVFCKTDDICYGNMHKRLKWDRTKTLAGGGDCCDFDLKVTDRVKKNARRR